jgi:parallel beta-helix repeat protein
MRKKIRKIVIVCLFLVMVASVFVVAVPKSCGGPSTPPWYGAIWIRPNGHIDWYGGPEEPPIQINFDTTTSKYTYTMTYNIEGQIYIEADDIILDGGGHSLVPSYNVIQVNGFSGITIRNVVVISPDLYGIRLQNSNNNNIIGNTITIPYWDTSTYSAIHLSNSHGNTITGNSIILDSDYADDYPPCYYYGIYLSSSSNNIVSGNMIMSSEYGQAIYLINSDENTIAGNAISGAQILHLYGGNGICLRDSFHNDIIGNQLTSLSTSGYGMALWFSGNNIIKGNTISNNPEAIRLDFSSSNSIFFNNFIDNTNQVWTSGSTNTWDNGEGKGNYWSDYIGSDLDGDGVGDTEVPHPYVSQGNGYFQLDYFPLVDPWSPESVPGLEDMVNYIQDPNNLQGIPDGMKNGLISQLDAAERALTDSAPQAARHILEGFLKHIEGLYKSGKLSDGEYWDLWSAVMEVLNSIPQ